MRPEDCPFRHDVERSPHGESAGCHLLEDLVGTGNHDALRVSREACEACVEQNPASFLAGHPVFPSLLHQYSARRMEQVSDSTGEIADDPMRLTRWRDWAEAWLVGASHSDVPSNAFGSWRHSCDVVMVVDRATACQVTPEDWAASIESAAEAVGVNTLVHVVAHGTELVLPRNIVGRWNVRLHQASGETSLPRTLAEIATSLSSPFIALHGVEARSHPRRLGEAIDQMTREGTEFFWAPVEHAGRVCPVSDEPGEFEAMGAPLASLVMRRAAWVEVGMRNPRALDSLSEFLRQARRDGYAWSVGDRARIVIPVQNAGTPGNTIAPDATSRSMAQPRSTSVPFPRVGVACDVVLPFHGHLDFAAEALESLLNQEHADCVIHVIDDASPEDTSSFRQRYGNCRGVRWYRNRANIGQFQSFNQVSSFFETGLAAIQDADDVSLPHRLSWTGNLLHYSGGEFFAGAVRLFGDSTVLAATASDTSRAERESLVRRSRYPRHDRDWYFAENPTTAFEVSLFRRMGGFADFGDPLMNRASIDTEFQCRCRFQHVRFALAREVVLNYRVHPQSATNNQATGWGSDARTRAGWQLEARRAAMARGPFDPRAFGSLGRVSTVIERL